MPENPASTPAPLTSDELSAFRRRRLAVSGGIYSMVLPLGAMYAFPEWAQRNPWLYQGYTVLVLGLLVGFLVAWRCPRCRAILFGQLNPKFCPRCGVGYVAGAGRR